MNKFTDEGERDGGKSLVRFEVLKTMVFQLELA